ncbi:ATP-binding cassette domain-containing protein, partial [Patescibacteria group bacterium]|nr:ATP-binding cassette domain-containing protein [Patescibacteria group bacterium]
MSDIIQVSNLTKKFNGFLAVDSVSFRVPQGSIFAFLGPNGAGKTTTIKMLTTLLEPTSGTMSVNGYDPAANQNSV